MNPMMLDVRDTVFHFSFLKKKEKKKSNDLKDWHIWSVKRLDFVGTLSLLPCSSLLELFFLCLLPELLLSSISPERRLCPELWGGAGLWTFLLLFLSVSSRLLFGALWWSEDEDMVRTQQMEFRYRWKIRDFPFRSMRRCVRVRPVSFRRTQVINVNNQQPFRKMIKNTKITWNEQFTAPKE